MTEIEFEYTPLTRVEMALYAMDYLTDYVGENENPDAPYEQLFVNLQELGPESFLVARLSLLEEIARAGAQAAGIDFVAPRTSQVQCTVILPLHPDKLSSAERAQAVGALNSLIPMGSFGSSDPDGIYFRYTLVSENADTLDAYLIAETLETCRGIVMKFSPDLEALCSGQTPLLAFMQKLAPGVVHV